MAPLVVTDYREYITQTTTLLILWELGDTLRYLTSLGIPWEYSTSLGRFCLALLTSPGRKGGVQQYLGEKVIRK